MARLGRARPNKPIIVRGTLVDPPVLTTPTPVVVSTAVPRQRRTINRPVLSRAVAEVVVAQATPTPIVVTGTGIKRGRGNRTLIVRADTTFATEAVPAPVVVAAPARRPRTASPWIVRTPQVAPVITDATPEPLVVVSPARTRWTGKPIVIRTIGETTPVPPGPGPDPDFCAGPPEIHWWVGKPQIDWVAGDPITSWAASTPEGDC
jgi:hypothetical protein